MMNILVTGAGGYIGTILVPMLLQRGYRVRALDRFFFGKDLLPDHENLELVKEDSRRINSTHMTGINAVIDLAAVSNDPSGELYQKATWEINFESRARNAKLAKELGVKRYILPSSCSIYGFQSPNVVVDEDSPTNPLTTYAKANEQAERDILPLSDSEFGVIVLRQATVYGYSPRMRFDLAINGMTFGAWKTGKLPLMRDGTQWRPMIHLHDVARANAFMISADIDKVNGEIFNVGSAENVYQIGPLGELVAQLIPRDVEIEWYGDPDHRSYRVSFEKLERVGYRAKLTAEDGIRDICRALENGNIDMTTETVTMDWYKTLHKWHKIIREVELYGGILDI